MHSAFGELGVQLARPGVYTQVHTGVTLWLFGIFAFCPFSEFRAVGLSAALVLVPLSIAALLYSSLSETFGPMK
jgi:hypothetical protein